MNTLMIRQSSGEFKSYGDFPTYALAIEAGATMAPFNFYIETGSRIPTREEQLGLEVKPKKAKPNKIKSIIDSL